MHGSMPAARKLTHVFEPAAPALAPVVHKAEDLHDTIVASELVETTKK